MYRKYATLIMMIPVIVSLAWCNVKAISINRVIATEAFKVKYLEAFPGCEETSFQNMIFHASSDQRIVDYKLLTEQIRPVYDLEDEDYHNLLRIVEAEAGNEDQNGKLLVANVVLNRVDSISFPDSVTGVVFQVENGTAQFSPVSNGSIYKVTISEDTVRAVERAIYGEDISQGALYFAARDYADPVNMQWFDSELTRLFAYGGHEFFY